MEWLKRYKLALGAVLLALILSGAYLYFFREDDEVALSRESSAPAASAAETELLSLLLSLRSVKLDDSLFTLPEFRSLVDFSREISPEPVGRANPFAPLEPSSLNR